MRIVSFVLILFMFVILLIESIFLFGLYQVLNGKKPLIDFGYDNFITQIEGKNFLEKNTKLYIISNYIITPETPISGVVEINGENKNFKNLTLKQLSQYKGIGKIYINQIGKIKLKGSLAIENIKNSYIYSDVLETNKDKNANKTN